jgi:hypothetical protein
MHVRQVVLEGDDRGRVVQRDAAVERLVEQMRAHARVVLVDEAVVGRDEAALADAQLRGGIGGGERMARDDLVEQRARCCIRRDGGRYPLHVRRVHARAAVRQKPAVAQDRRGERVAARA